MAAADVAGPSAETDASTAPQTRSDEVATCQDDIRKDRLDILASLPVQLVYETGPDIFKKASQALVRLCPNVCFVRWQIVSESMEQADAFDFCRLKQLSTQMSSVPFGDSCFHRVITAAHEAAKKQEGLQQHALISNQPQYCAAADLQGLQALGVRAHLVLPVTLGREVLGALCLAASQDNTFTPSDVADIRTVVAMVAPHTAVIRRSRKSDVARTVLNTMLPMRVLELIVSGLGRKTVKDF